MRRGLLQELTQRESVFISTASECYLGYCKCVIPLKGKREDLTIKKKERRKREALKELGIFPFSYHELLFLGLWIMFFQCNPYFHKCAHLILYENRIHLFFKLVNMLFLLFLPLSFLVLEWQNLAAFFLFKSCTC